MLVEVMLARTLDAASVASVAVALVGLAGALRLAGVFMRLRELRYEWRLARADSTLVQKKFQELDQASRPTARDATAMLIAWERYRRELDDPDEVAVLVSRAKAATAGRHQAAGEAATGESATLTDDDDGAADRS